MSLVFEKLTQTLAAGQVWRLNIAADFFRIAAAAWPVKVRIMKAGRIMGEMDGWQAGDFVRDVDFDAVEVQAGSIAQTVTVQIAGGGVGSDRVIGEVSVIDGGATLTNGGRAFVGEYTQHGAAGQFAASQLWNPLGSGVEVQVGKILVGASLESTVTVGLSQTALTDTGLKVISKRTGGAVGKTQRRASLSAGAPAGMTNIFVAVANANSPLVFEFKEPIVITEGWGITGYSTALAASFSLLAEVLE